jgi:hypothetical protein
MEINKKKRHKVMLALKKNLPYFKKKYGKGAEDVLQGTATKVSMEERISNALDMLVEEVVNPENQPMTKAEIIRRDRLAKSKKIRDYVSIVNPKDKSLNNAAHRYATYIVMRMRGSKRGKAKPTETKSRKKKGKK